MKNCISCKEIKAESEFYAHKRMSGGTINKCKACCKTRTIWQNIMSRCYDVAYKDYPSYGGRGITLCDEWRDFLCFKLWYKNNHSRGMQIDRSDNNKGYSPQNCRFVTPSENCRNRRSNTLNKEILNTANKMMAEGESLTITANLLGVSRQTLRSAIAGDSWKDFEFSKEVIRRYPKFSRN